MLAFDLKNGLVNVDGHTYTLNNDMEFQADGQVYLVYFSTLSTRTHHNVYDYTDKSFKIPALILKSTALKLIQHFANIAAYGISLSSVPVTHTFGETMSMLKGELTDFNKSTHHSDDVSEAKNGAVQNTLSILNTLLDSFDLNDCDKGIRAAKPIKIYLNTNNQPLSVVLEMIIEFIFAYTSYSESTILYQSLNTYNYILYSVMRILFIQQSTFQSDLFTDPTELLLHYFITIVIDLLTDKCSYELYIKQRHPEATSLVKKYYNKYPVLYRVLGIQDLQKLPNAFFEEAASEPIKMLPYMATFSMSPKDRILYVYDYFINSISKNSTSLDKANKSSKWLSSEEFWSLLQHLTVGVENEKYNSDAFVSVLPKLLNMLKDNADIDPTVSELLKNTSGLLQSH